jgi:hypothetical protein
MKYNYADSPFVRALIRKYEYEKDEAIANLNVYFTNSVGISEHSDFVAEMDRWLSKLAAAEENLKVLVTTFVNVPQQAPPGPPESGEDS